MKKNIYRILLLLCITIFLVSGFMIAKYFYEQYQSQSEFAGLSSVIRAKAELSEQTELTAVDTKKEAYLELQQRNADFSGWIRIEGTKIDYPVMQTVTDPEFYLHRSFEKEDSRHGTPFADYRASLNPLSDNILIYGHHMHDGTMFADLIQYTDYSFFENHPIIQFDTLIESGEYQIAAVFKTPSEGSDVFFYNNYIDFASEEDFNTYYAEVQRRALYDTGIPLQFGDKLITLSTCEYSLEDNGRLAIVAKRIMP